MNICNFKIHINKNDYDEFVLVAIKTAKVKQANETDVNAALDDIKEAVLDRVERYIDSRRKRPALDDGHEKIIDVLRETSFVEQIDKETWRLNIGDLASLDGRVPYWRLLNYGGRPQGLFKFGIFGDGAPVRDGGGNVWLDGDKTMHMMHPTKPIEPTHYLGYMAQEFLKEIRKYK